MHRFKYLVANNRDIQWGLTISTVGYAETEPLAPYPSTGHADGYYFRPEKGRILNEYQILYIIEGEGIFNSAHKRATEVRSGDVFFLFPGEWHSYYPKPETGWKEYWIGFKGENMDHRVKAGFLSPEKPIYHVGYSNDIIRLYDSAIQTAEDEAVFSQQILAGIVNHLIGMVYSLERNIHLNKDISHAEAINRAKNIIRDNLENDLSIQEIALQIGVGYSNFRKLFKLFAGVSPALYQQDLRLQRAKELLSITQMNINEIAYMLHFDSADYFSTKFKKKTGFTPSQYREMLNIINN
jgi:AraC-like DNA-binding protein